MMNREFRNLGLSLITVAAMERLRIQVPRPAVTGADMRRKFHQTVAGEKKKK